MITATTGQELFLKYCAMCHGQDGMQVQRARLGQKQWLGSKGSAFLAKVAASGKPAAGMPAFGLEYGGFMAQEEILAIFGYLNSVAE